VPGSVFELPEFELPEQLTSPVSMTIMNTASIPLLNYFLPAPEATTMAANAIPEGIAFHCLGHDEAETCCGPVVLTVTFAVTGALPVTCTEPAEQEASSMAGGVVQVRLMVPVNPLAELMVTGIVPLWPAWTVVGVDDAGTTVNSAATTTMVICTEGAAR